jgi:flagellar basal-body rod protein FlgF
MLRGIYTAAGGMLSQQISINSITNNMANSETTGYKKDTAVMSPFKEHLMYYLDSSQSPKAAPIGGMPYGVEVYRTDISFKQGNLEPTGRALDLAIEGDGFFVVQAPDGIRLTRNGSFKVDAENYLVTGQGYRVLGQDGFIVVNGDNFSIEEDGRVIEDGVEIEQVMVLDFTDRSAIQKDRDSLLSAPDDLDAVVPQYKIRQGYLERSNVEMNQEMSSLLVAYRAYEANSRVFQAYDQIMQQAVRDIGSLR